MNLKNLETSLTRLSDQYDKVQGDITETFKVNSWILKVAASIKKSKITVMSEEEC